MEAGVTGVNGVTVQLHVAQERDLEAGHVTILHLVMVVQTALAICQVQRNAQPTAAQVKRI